MRKKHPSRTIVLAIEDDLSDEKKAHLKKRRQAAPVVEAQIITPSDLSLGENHFANIGDDATAARRWAEKLVKPERER